MYLSSRIAVIPLLVSGLVLPNGQAPPVTIRLNEAARPGSTASFDVVNLKPADLETLAKVKWQRDQWIALFAVVVDGGSPAAQAQRLPLLGSYQVHDGVLRFEPRFPLEPGLRYRATFHPSKVPNSSSQDAAVVADFDRPSVKPGTPAVVEQVYPTADVLPENQFRFYLHFSAPMSQGQAYKHIQLLDAAGKPLSDVFLDIEEELWDAGGRRFTLFFHPGRVKKGLKPREELGPILEEGKSYTLVIDRGWNDAKGRPLKESFRKTFRAGPAQEQFPGLSTWKIQSPPPGTDKPLRVTFPKPLDHALLHRLLWVADAEGRRVAGTVAVTDAERCWQLTPNRPWRAGTYSLVADTRLEDSAGNSIKGPFEVDVFHPIQREVKSETTQLPVAIGTRN
jgi:hypothetical protein